MGALVLAAATLLCSAAAAAAEGVPMQGAWRPAAQPDAAAVVFDPARLTGFGRPSGGARVVLSPRGGAWPAGAWVLSVESPGLQRITLQEPGPPQRAHVFEGGGRPAYGRLAFAIDALPAAGRPLQLHVDATGVVPGPVTFVLRTPEAQAGVEARWLAFATACLATMLVTAVIAAFFGLRLRDAAFGWYAAYVVTYALIHATQSGYLARPLGAEAFGLALPLWGRAVTTLSVISAVFFLDRFVDLRARHPRLRRVLQGYCLAMLLVSAAAYVPALQALARALVNPMLILGGPLALGTALVAARAGSRYALLFLLGWIPLLGLTVLGSAQLYGVAPGWTWTDDAAFAVGAFEAVVLSLGLAERAASVRQQRDQARALAQTDSLTGLLNRRALREALQEVIAAGEGRLSVIYLDLDHFKRVNDRFGHEAGDQALRVFVDVLRTAVRDHDVVGRYGGEEFVVGLLRTGPDEAIAIAERIRTGLHVRTTVAGDMPLTVSAGVATRRPGEPLDALLMRADAALYAAKDSGRDRVQVA